MQLTRVQVQDFKSIDNSGPVTIDPQVTVLVGQNEAGKTAFLQALEKARPIREGVDFDVTEDYPRKALNEYRREHEKNPAPVVTVTYELNSQEFESVNQAMGARVLTSPEFSLTYLYDGGYRIGLTTDESAFVKAAIKKAKLPSELTKSASAAASVREIIRILEESDLNTEAQAFLDSLKNQFAESLKSKWTNAVSHEVWRAHIGTPPKFLYFGDYQLLPGR
jgi:hypothetical protein